MTEERKKYLESLADDFCIDESVVFMCADMLGEGEDYDGLISALEDYEEDDLFD